MRRLHPLVGAVRALQYGLYGFTVPFFGISMAANVFDGLIGILFPTVILGGLAGVIYGAVSYARYTYGITEETFDVASGVVGRRKREIPHRRIQNVDVTRSFWQKLLEVATVRIETAGGGSTEALLDFVADPEAERLQQALRERRVAARRDEATEDAPEGDAHASGSEGEGVAGENTEAAEAEPAGHREEQRLTGLFVLSDVELAIHAATTFRPGVLGLLVIGTPLLGELVADLLVALAAPLGGPESLVLSTLSPDEALAVAIVGVPLGIASAWALGMAIGVNQYYGFRLGRRGEELVYDRGLLSEFSGTIPLEKVQTLTVTENVFQRALGYAGLSIDTAGYAGGNSGQGGNRSAIPLAKRERVITLVDLLEGATLDAAFTRPPKRARERYVVRYALALGAVLAVAFGASRAIAGFSLWWAPGLLAPAIPVAAHFKWKHRGYALGENHLLVRSGFLIRRTQVVPYHRLQTVTRSRTVFQRRRNLAHLIADTASGGVLNRVHPVAYDQSDERMRTLQTQLRERLQTSLRE
ncbi:MAG: PH domain-containing protein [Halobacteriales archaeon]